MVRKISESASTDKKLVDRLANSEDKMFSIERTYFPLALVVGLISGTAYLATAISNERARIDSKILELGTLVTSVQTSVQNVEKLIQNKNSDVMHRSEMVAWCIQAEQRNPTFRCPTFVITRGTDND